MALRISFTILLLLNFLLSYSQNREDMIILLDKTVKANPDSALLLIKKYDSLKIYNNKTITDAKYLIIKAKALENSNEYTTALHLLTEALHIYNKLNNDKERYRTLYRLAKLYSETGVDSKAKEYYTKAYNIAKDINIRDAWDCLYYAARIDISDKDFDGALEKLDTAAVNLTIKDTTQSILAEVLNIKGIIYLRIDDFESALKVLDSARQINEEINDKISLGINYTNIGRLYFNKKNYYTAHKYFKEAYSIDSSLNNTKGIFTKSLNLASSYIRLRRWQEAEKIYKYLLTVPDIKTDYKFMSNLHHNMAILYYDHDRHKLTGKHLNKAIEYAEKIDDRDFLSDLYFLKSRNEFYYNNNKDKAYLLLEKSLDIKNKIYAKNIVNTIKSYQLKTKIIENDIENNIKNRKLADDNNNLKSKLNTTLLVLIIVIVLSAMLYVLMRRKIRTNINSFKRYKDLIRDQKERYTQMNNKFNTIVSENNSVKEIAEHTKNDLDKLIMLIEESGKITLDCIDTAKKCKDEDVSEKLIEKLKRLDKIISGNDIIKYHLDNEYSEFRYKLNQKFTSLTKGEEQLCILIRYNYSVGQIATYTNTSQKTIEVARYRLRKKLGFDNNNDFYDMLNNL